MIQELSRVESNCRLLIQEKGPVGAATVIYFQRDHASRNLVSTKNSTISLEENMVVYATNMNDIKRRETKMSYGHFNFWGVGEGGLHFSFQPQLLGAKFF